MKVTNSDLHSQFCRESESAISFYIVFQRSILWVKVLEIAIFMTRLCSTGCKTKLDQFLFWIWNLCRCDLSMIPVSSKTQKLHCPVITKCSTWEVIFWRKVFLVTKTLISRLNSQQKILQQLIDELFDTSIVAAVSTKKFHRTRWLSSQILVQREIVKIIGPCHRAAKKSIEIDT